MSCRILFLIHILFPWVKYSVDSNEGDSDGELDIEGDGDGELDSEGNGDGELDSEGDGDSELDKPMMKMLRK